MATPRKATPEKSHTSAEKGAMKENKVGGLTFGALYKIPIPETGMVDLLGWRAK